MADISNGSNIYAPLQARTQWGAIWAGFFSFVAIWSVFSLLGEAIFAGAVMPNAPKGTGGWSTGMEIWAIVLSIIAMYVGGKVTGRLASVYDRADAMLHGMTMFGLAVISTVAFIVVAGTTVGGGAGINGTTSSNNLLSIFNGLGWWGFVSLFLGWLAALGGSASEVRPAVNSAETPKNVQDIRAA